jgi:hypothetical protein
MFSPSPCPGHYSRRLATMASADSCLHTIRITPYDAAQHHFLSAHLCFVSHKWGRDFHHLCRDIWEPVAPAGDFTGNNIILHGKQVSPDKNVNFRYATASFTVSPVPWALTCCAALPRDSALYDVSVRRPTSLHSGFLQTLPRDNALAFG